ncbi:hypothetical protein ACFWBR_00750 [Streptomyces sp. NPDC060006]|uniref:hypothetical protein n=1 Tax=unclassified Streptomyces TaxID=2593676 RepID=UPI003634887D
MRSVRALVKGGRGWAAVSGWVLGFGLVVSSATTATAGGPTSVLVVSPESGLSTALYTTSEEYRELERLLGQPGSGTSEEPPGLGVGSSQQINVTWMLHDVSPWRVDRVYPDTRGSKKVWIHTAANAPESMNGYWHTAKQPAAIRALLKRIGVLGEPSGKGAGVADPTPAESEDASAAPAPASTEQSRTAVAATTDDTDWWWAIPGLVTGAVLGLGLRPFVGRWPGVRRLSHWRERESGPRQELRDV